MKARAKLENRRSRGGGKPSGARAGGSSLCKAQLALAFLTFLRTSRICFPLREKRKMAMRMKHLCRVKSEKRTPYKSSHLWPPLDSPYRDIKRP
jgi:hypothetical protein